MSRGGPWQISMTGEDMLEQLLYLSTLFDLYGPLLTEKQQECLRLHLFEDFSLAEIGESLGISRQAVYDNIHRAQKAMEGYEEKLELARRYHLERQELTELAGKIEGLRQPGNEAAVDDILERLTPLLGQAGQEA
jgi:predicted DNA-binding protein YlxM (UPF0122 family)